MLIKDRKIRVGIMFGGQSAEWLPSIQSTQNVLRHVDENKYEVTLIGIDKNGTWAVYNDLSHYLRHNSDKTTEDEVVFSHKQRGHLINIKKGETVKKIDVVFPILHGPPGENGPVQGILQLANLPFVGAGVLGSAIGMDKDVQKRLLNAAGIPTAKFMIFRNNEKRVSFAATAQKLNLPLFIKPSNLGSSIGVSKVIQENEFENAVNNAFQYDSKILVEGFVRGREIECCVLGNETLSVSPPGEISTSYEYLSYDAKCTDKSGTVLQVPAKMSAATTQNIQLLAKEVYKTLSCAGIGRVDFFLEENANVVVNELNTLPSMFPQHWTAEGMSYRSLFDKLVLLAFERYEQEKGYELFRRSA